MNQQINLERKYQSEDLSKNKQNDAPDDEKVYLTAKPPKQLTKDEKTQTNYVSQSNENGLKNNHPEQDRQSDKLDQGKVFLTEEYSKQLTKDEKTQTDDVSQTNGNRVQNNNSKQDSFRSSDVVEKSDALIKMLLSEKDGKASKASDKTTIKDGKKLSLTRKEDSEETAKTKELSDHQQRDVIAGKESSNTIKNSNNIILLAKYEKTQNDEISKTNSNIVKNKYIKQDSSRENDIVKNRESLEKEIPLKKESNGSKGSEIPPNNSDKNLALNENENSEVIAKPKDVSEGNENVPIDNGIVTYKSSNNTQNINNSISLTKGHSEEQTRGKPLLDVISQTNSIAVKKEYSERGFFRDSDIVKQGESLKNKVSHEKEGHVSECTEKTPNNGGKKLSLNQKEDSDGITNHDENNKENPLPAPLEEDKSDDSFDLAFKKIRHKDRGSFNNTDKTLQSSKQVKKGSDGKTERENKKRESLKKELSLEKEGNGLKGSEKPQSKGGKKLPLRLNSLVKGEKNN